MAQKLKSVTTLLQASLRTIGILAGGETATDDDLAAALESFQDMLAELAVDSLFVPFITSSAIPLTAGTGAYTIGQYSTDSPDLAAYPPIEILDAFVRDSDKNDYPVSIMSLSDFSSIRAKYSTNYTSGRPEYIFFNPTAPNVTIYLEPWPTSAYEYLYIFHAKPFEEPISLSLDLANAYYIPRYYHNPLKWMLAVELCPEFGRDPTNVMLGKASGGYSNLISINAANRVQAAKIEVPTESAMSSYGGGTILDS